MDQDTMQHVYGAAVTPEDALSGKVAPPPQVQWTLTLNLTPPRR